MTRDLTITINAFSTLDDFNKVISSIEPQKVKTIKFILSSIGQNYGTIQSNVTNLIPKLTNLTNVIFDRDCFDDEDDFEEYYGYQFEAFANGFIYEFYQHHAKMIEIEFHNLPDSFQELPAINNITSCQKH